MTTAKRQTKRTWLLALALAVSACEATHVRAPILEIDQLLEAPLQSMLEEQQAKDRSNSSNSLRGAAGFQKEELAIEGVTEAQEKPSLNARLFQKEEMEIELQENEAAIERRPVVVMEVAQEPLLEEDEDEEEDTDSSNKNKMEAFLQEEAEIERELGDSEPQAQASQPSQRLRRRAIGVSWSENLNQKTHKTALGSFFQAPETPNRPVTETSGMHTNKVAQQMFFEEDLMDEMMGATIMQFSMGR